MKKTLLCFTLLLTAIISQGQDTLTAYFMEYDEGDSLLVKTIKRVYVNEQSPLMDFDEDYTHPLGTEFDYYDDVIYFENADEYFISEVGYDSPLHLSTKIHSINRANNKLTYLIDYYEPESNVEWESRDSISITFKKDAEYNELDIITNLSSIWNMSTLSFDTSYFKNANYLKTQEVQVQYQRTNSPIYNDSARVIGYELKTVLTYDSTLQNEFYDKTSSYDVINGEKKLTTIREDWYNSDSTQKKSVRISYPQVITYLGDTIPDEIDTTTSLYSYSNNNKCQIENTTATNYDPTMSKWCFDGLSQYYIGFDEGEKIDSTIYNYNQDSTIQSLESYDYYDGEYHLYEKEVLTNNEVTVTDENNNVIGRYFFTVPIEVGLNEKATAKSLSFYPNPVESTITLDKAGNGTIFTLTGNEIKPFEGNTVDVSGLTKGMYLIQLIDENGQLYTSKFIKN